MRKSFKSLSRRGFGLFVVAVGVIVVLAAIVGINQLQSMTSATRDTTEAIELTHKTTLVAESAADEGCWASLALDLNNPDAQPDGLYLKLRGTVPPADASSVPANGQPVFNGATPYVFSGKVDPSFTYDSMKADPELRLNSGDPVYYGPTELTALYTVNGTAKQGFMPESNETRGIMAFAHTVSAKGYGWLKEIDQSVQFFRPFRCLNIGIPWPYGNYSIFVRQFYGDRSLTPTSYQDMWTAMEPPAFGVGSGMFKKRGPIPSAYAEFLRKVYWQDRIVKIYTETMTAAGKTPTKITTSGVNFEFSQLNRPWVFEGDQNGASTTALLNSDADVQALKGIEPLPNGVGLEDVSVKDWLAAKMADPARDAELQQVIQKLNDYGTKLAAIWAKMPLKPVSKDLYDKYYNDASTTSATVPAFKTISAPAWLARATRVYQGAKDLDQVKNKDKSAFELNGVYYFQGADTYVLDKPYTGKGILVFEGNVTVGGFTPSDTESHAVIVATPQAAKFDPISISVVGDVTADLIAPYGTVQGDAGANPTATIKGGVLVQFLADALAPGNNFFDGAANGPMFPVVDRGNKTEWDFQPPAAGGAYDKKYAKHMQVYFDPGYVKKLYWSKRDRRP